MKYEISIVICTYNRSLLLNKALKSLERQDFPLEQFEVIIIDNNSTDDTPKIAKRYCDKHLTWTYYFEKKQGLSIARNRGIAEVKSRYIGYLDDDGKASQVWIKIAHKIIREYNPAVFGGPYYAYYNSEKPYWWKDEYRSYKPSEETRELKKGEYLSGSNIFFKKEMIKKLGGFKTSIGMKGDKISLGEETELQIRIRNYYPQKLIYSDPKLYIYHLVHGKKMSFKWLVKHRFLHGITSLKVLNKKEKSFQSFLKLSLYTAYNITLLLYHVSIGVICRKKSLYPNSQNYMFEVVLNDVRQVSRRLAILKNYLLIT